MDALSPPSLPLNECDDIEPIEVLTHPPDVDSEVLSQDDVQEEVVCCDYDNLSHLSIANAVSVFDTSINNVIFSCDVKRKALSAIDISPLSYSTMTIMVNTNISDVRATCKDPLATFPDVGKCVQIVCSDPMLTETITPLLPEGFNIPDKHFVNSTIVKFKRDGQNRKAIKVFNNGRLHITGAKSALEAIDDARTVCRIIDVAMGLKLGTTTPTSFDIQMINSNFRVNKAFNLDLLRSLLESKYSDVSHAPKYDKEHHAAMRFRFHPANAKFMSRGRQRKSAAADVTILIFMSGSVVMTGAKHPIHLKEAFDFVCTTLNRHIDELKVLNYVHRKRKSTNTDGVKPPRKQRVTKEKDSFYSMFKL